MEIFFVSSKTQSEPVCLVITFMHFLKGLNNGKTRKNKNIEGVQADYSMKYKEEWQKIKLDL